MLEWLKIKTDYGVKHLASGVVGSVEQYSDGRVEMWGLEEFKAREGIAFESVRKAKLAFRKNYT